MITYLRNLQLSLIQLILITLFHLLYFSDISDLKIHYFEHKRKLYYVNPLTNYKGDLYFEHWGEEENNRYFFGINATTGEEIYFENEKIKTIEASQSNYHSSIIINDDNNNDHIFSINLKTYNLEFINLKTGVFSYKSINDIFQIEIKEDTRISYRSSIIKLKNGNYLSSFVIYKKYGLINKHIHYFQIFNFESYGMEGFNQIEKTDPTCNPLNSTQCFQTESEYLQCSYINILDNLYIKIYDLNFNEKTKKVVYFDPNIFNYIFHIKKEIGAFVYFNNQNPFPIIQIKNLKDNHKDYIDLFECTLDFNEQFVFNNGLFYSDAIKLNDDKFAVILTSQDLLNIIICLFDLYNNDNSLRLRYYNLPVNQINIKISVNIRAFKFGNLLGISFYDSISEYPGHLFFNYAIFKNESNYIYINDTTIEIKLFTNSSSYSFPLSEKMEIINNIFGVEIIGIKILNFDDKFVSGVLIQSSNSIISKNDELYINDQLIFEPFLTGAIPGQHVLTFSVILKESNDTESFADLTKNYNRNNDNNNDYEPKTFIGNVLKIIFTVECKEECKTCHQYYTDSNYFCVKCKDEYPYFYYEKSECKSECNDTVLIKGNIKYCIDSNDAFSDHISYEDNQLYGNDQCEQGNFLYKIGDEIFCIDNCGSEQFVYINENNETYCYDNCNDNQTIIVKDNVQYCINDCENDKFIYINQNNQKYCSENCDKYIYIDEDNTTYCFDNCKTNQYIIEKENNKYCIDYCENDKYIYINENNEKYCINDCESDKYIYISEDNSKYCADNCKINQYIILMDYREYCIDNCNKFIYIDPNDNKYCYDNCENNQFRYTKNTNEEYCLSSCSDHDLFLDNEINKCYSDCSENENSKIYSYQGECLSKCPDGYEANSNNVCDNFILSMIFDYNNDKNPLIKKVINDTIFTCYSTKTNSENLIDSAITYLRLNECENKLKQEYGLEKDSELLIIGKETPTKSSNKAINDYEYEIYTADGEKLDDSVCDNMDIEISYIISNLNLIDFEKAILLFNQGYDIFNKSSDFYYDYCLSAYIDNSELTLEIRQKEIYPGNISLCSKGCKYNGINLDNKRVNCLCNSNYEEEIEEHIEEVEQNFFIYFINMINYQIIFCYKLINEQKSYINNYGFYIQSFLFILMIINVFVYECKGKQTIKKIFFNNIPKIELNKNIIDFGCIENKEKNKKDNKNKNAKKKKIIVKKKIKKRKMEQN